MFDNSISINLRKLFTSTHGELIEFDYYNVIYCIHNDVNNKCYIGQARSFLNRFTSDEWISHLSGYTYQCMKLVDYNQIIYHAINKYKSRNFTVYILEVDLQVEYMNSREKYWIETLHTCVYDPNCNGYNMTWGGEDTSQMHTELANSHRIETNRLRYGEKYAWDMGACHTPEAERKQQESASETNRLRYGEDYAYVTGGCHTEDAVKKRIETNRKRYGEKYASTNGACQTPEARAKKDETFLRIYGTTAGAMNEEYSIIKRNLTNIYYSLKYLHDYFENNPNLEINPNTICSAPVGPILRGAIINLSKVDKYYFDEDEIYRKIEDSYRWMTSFIKDDGTIDWESLTTERLNTFSNPELRIDQPE